MLKRIRAFTLMELLVVTVILAALAAMLLPVFSTVVATSRARVCVSNFHQVALASGLYGQDYDDRMMPVSDASPGSSNSSENHTWVQSVLPYTRNFSVFHCPSDTTRTNSDEATFDQDLVPGDTYSEYYTASLHVNTGYNYQYLAPILLENNEWVSSPVTDSQIRDPSRTLLFVDSVWAVSNGEPYGGGNWLVVPPCRYEPTTGGHRQDTFLAGSSATQVFVFSTHGWSSSLGASTSPYGGAWPWHLGRITTVSVDGTLRSLTPADLSAGCDVGPAWTGPISDPQQYLWKAK